MMQTLDSAAGRHFLAQLREIVAMRTMTSRQLKVAALRHLADELEPPVLQPVEPDLDRWRAFWVDAVADPERRPGYMLDQNGQRLTDADSLVLLALVPLVATVRHHQLAYAQSAVRPVLTLIVPAACWSRPEQVNGGRLMEMPIRVDPQAAWPAVAVEVI